MKLKRILIITLSGILVVGLIMLFAVHFMIRKDVKEHMELAQQRYSGTPEEALIAFMQDEENVMYDRIHTGIWTLGQIRSEKALPILKSYYKDDPKGETCLGKHDSMLCQYEIHKAIWKIEKGWMFSHARLK